MSIYVSFNLLSIHLYKSLSLSVSFSLSLKIQRNDLLAEYLSTCVPLSLHCPDPETLRKPLSPVWLIVALVHTDSSTYLFAIRRVYTHLSNILTIPVFSLLFHDVDHSISSYLSPSPVFHYVYHSIISCLRLPSVFIIIHKHRWRTPQDRELISIFNIVSAVSWNRFPFQNMNKLVPLFPWQLERIIRIQTFVWRDLSHKWI